MDAQKIPHARQNQPPEVRERVVVRVGDMRMFTLAERFALIIASFRGFLHNLTEHDQLACLGGNLAVGWHVPARRRRVHCAFGVQPVRHGAATGRFAAPLRGVRTGRYPHPDIAAPTPLAYLYPRDLRRLLKDAGFQSVQIAGGFDGRPFENDTDELVINKSIFADVQSETVRKTLNRSFGLLARVSRGCRGCRCALAAAWTHPSGSGSRAVHVWLSSCQRVFSRFARLHAGLDLSGRVSIREHGSQWALNTSKGQVGDGRSHSASGDRFGAYFAEGVTDWSGQLVQLTWQSHIGFLYDLATFNVARTFTYSGERWGLTHDRTRLIISDGSERLRFLDPKTLWHCLR
jgi:hypothetical protein